MKKRSTFTVVGAMILASALLLSACASSASAEKGTETAVTAQNQTKAAETVAEKDQTGENEKDPVVVTIARGTDTVTLDPAFAGDNVDIWVDSLIFEGLVRASEDGKEIEPCLADTWEISDDGLTYTFHLRDEAKFSDGTDVTAEDAAFSINRSLNEGSWNSLISCIKEAKAVDEDTVEIDLNNPSGSLLSCLASFICAIYPESYYSTADADTLTKEPLGTGAFYLEEWKPDEKMILKKNPYYWETGYPLADEIDLLVVPDDNTRLMQLQAGQIDAMEGVSAQMREQLQNTAGVNIIDFPTTHVDYVSFNYTSEKLNDKRVRQALNYATNREDINQAVFGGLGTLCPSVVWPTAEYFNPDQKSYDYDPDKAKELLAEAGAENLDLNLIISTGDASSLMEATILKDQWSKVGVNLNIEQMDSSARRDARNNLTFEVLLNYFTSDITDTAENMEMFCIKDNFDCWHLGWNGADQEEAEELVKEAGATTDKEIRKTNYYKAQEIMADNALIIPLVTLPETVAVRDNVSGFEQGILGNYYFNELTINN